MSHKWMYGSRLVVENHSPWSSGRGQAPSSWYVHGTRSRREPLPLNSSWASCGDWVECRYVDCLRGIWEFTRGSFRLKLKRTCNSCHWQAYILFRFVGLGLNGWLDDAMTSFRGADGSIGMTAGCFQIVWEGIVTNLGWCPMFENSK